MRSLPKKYFYLLICICLLAILFGTQTTYAASFNVSTAAELIDAINTANSNNADDVITLVADITLTAVDNTTVDGPNGLPVIVSDSGHSLTINGGGHRIARSTDVGVPDFRRVVRTVLIDVQTD